MFLPSRPSASLAGTPGLAIHQYGAGTTDADITTDLGAGEKEAFPQPGGKLQLWVRGYMLDIVHNNHWNTPLKNIENAEREWRIENGELIPPSFQ
jgi:hypothetical protein